MRKIALLLAVLVCLTSCHKPDIKNTFKIVTGASSSEQEEPLPESSPTEPEGEKEDPLPSEPEIKEPEEAERKEPEDPEIKEPEDPQPSSGNTSVDEQAQAKAASEAAAFEAAQRAAAEAKAAEEARRAAAEAAAFEAEQRAAEEAQRAAEEAAAFEAEQRAAEEAQKAAAEAAQKASVKKASASGKNFLSDIESEVLALQNQERARLGIPALQYDPELQNAARIRSRELCQAGVFAHTRPDGRQWNTVLIEDVPYDYLSAGENLAIVESSDPNIDLPEDPDFWVDGWINSPSHYKNMIRAEYNRAGVGIYKVVRNGETCAIATTIFAYVEE